MNDELKDQVVKTEDIPERLLPDVGATYTDDIGRTLLVEEVVPDDGEGREVRGRLSATKSRHSSTDRYGHHVTRVIDVPAMDAMPYACQLWVFEKLWARAR